MNRREDLVEQHILEYEARLKHIDELFQKVEKRVEQEAEKREVKDELVKLRKEREQFLSDIEELKQASRKEWQENTIEEGGPMIIWEAVAKRLEALLERISR